MTAISRGSRMTSSLSSLSLKPESWTFSDLSWNWSFLWQESLGNQIAFSCQSLTSSKVDEDVAKKNSVRDHVEDDPAVVEVEMKVREQPAGGEVIVEEGDGDGEDDEVGNEQQEHADVPIKS